MLISYCFKGISEIALDIAALNEPGVKPCDKEKIWTILGPELSSDEGKKTLIVWALLYGMKSAGASFSRHISDCMRHIGISVMQRLMLTFGPRQW